MKLEFRDNELYKDDNRLGYIEYIKDNEPSDKYVFWFKTSTGEYDLHYFEDSLEETKKAVLEDYETTYAWRWSYGWAN